MFPYQNSVNKFKSWIWNWRFSKFQTAYNALQDKLGGLPSQRLRRRLSLIYHLCLAKQIDRINQDVIGEKYIQNDAGELSLSDDKKKMKA